MQTQNHESFAHTGEAQTLQKRLSEIQNEQNELVTDFFLWDGLTTPIKTLTDSMKMFFSSYEKEGGEENRRFTNVDPKYVDDKVFGTMIMIDFLVDIHKTSQSIDLISKRLGLK